MWRKSEVWKNKFFLIVAAVQVILLFAGLVGVCRGSRVVADWSSMRVTANGGAAGAQEGTFAIDGEDGYRGRFLEFDGFTLSPGVYRMTLTCDSEDNDVNVLGIECAEQAFQTLRANDIPIYANNRESVSDFYVLRKMGPEDGLKVYVEYKGRRNLAVEDLEIVKTSAGSRMLLFFVFVLSLVADSVIMLYSYLGKYPVEREKLMVWFGVPALAVAASLPLLTDYALTGADFIYHWGRIEALAEGIRDGAIPLRMGTRWLYGHGYASSLFYPDTFLTIPALLRLIGFSLSTSYRMFLFVVNLGTALIAYVSFRGIFRDRRLGMLGCMLFTLAPYRVYSMYNRSAVGEFVAMMFLPLLCWGFYLLFAEDVHSERYRRYWIIPTFGFTGIIQSHLLSCEMVGTFTVLLCLIMIKRVFCRQTFVELVKVVLGTVLLNLWFLLPCLDMMASGEYYYSNNTNVYIQNRGVLWANLLDTMQAAGVNSRFHEYGLQGTEPIGVGVAALFGIAAFWVLRRRTGEVSKATLPESTRDKSAVVATILGALGLVLSSAYFPWDFIKSKVRVLGGVVSMIQFPTRLTIIPMICATLIGCAAGMWALRRERRIRVGFFGLICGGCILFSLYQTNDTLMVKDGFFRIYTSAAIGNSGILGAEYMPQGVSFPTGYHGPEASEGVEIADFGKDGLNCRFYVVAEGTGEHYVDLPMIYYKGYHVTNGADARITASEDGHVRVMLPEGGCRGEIAVGYTGMWYWHAAEIVSLLTIVGLTIYLFLTFRGKFNKINAAQDINEHTAEDVQ